LFVVVVVAAVTDQPAALWNLALGLGLGICIGTFAMLGEVRKLRAALNE